ncbi:MAG: class I SAM-dependent methyltransferase [Deltaproteobacteria bacterium]|nr:class I SAM-dependent methyltransferase [Deltaproteobacteria bacterium]MBI3296062.1 class I SAM-dependent methyltransferase [Deltaproteobacteria bacterium]
MFRKPDLEILTTTLWEYPSQHYGSKMQGNQDYRGATPSYVIWNLLKRYTREGDTVLDPMCGSGTTIDVCADLKRKAIGFDLRPIRVDIQQADARFLPIKKETVDFVFMDPPYSTHLEYSDDTRCLGKLDTRDGSYYEAMEKVFGEMFRVLKDRRYVAVYVSDSFKKGKPFSAIGFELYARLSKLFRPVDIVAVVRHNKTLKRNHWHTSAVDGNYFLRGFNYLLIFKKEIGPKH